MVYIVPTSLVVNPSSPNTSDQLIISAIASIEFWDKTCQFPYLWTQTDIHLLQKLPNQTWAQSNLVYTIDCKNNCCFDEANPAWSNGTIRMTFPPLDPLPVGKYDFMVIDDSDYVVGNFSLSTAATKTVTVVHDPYCIENPCDDICPQNCTSCPTDPRCAICQSIPCTVGCPSANNCAICPDSPACKTICTDNDYFCQIVEYAKANPLVVVAGAVVLYLLMSPPRKSK